MYINKLSVSSMKFVYLFIRIRFQRRKWLVVPYKGKNLFSNQVSLNRKGEKNPQLITELRYFYYFHIQKFSTFDDTFPYSVCIPLFFKARFFRNAFRVRRVFCGKNSRAFQLWERELNLFTSHSSICVKIRCICTFCSVPSVPNSCENYL